METIIKNVDYLCPNLAAAQCGTGYVTIEKSYVKYFKDTPNVKKVILRTKNAWGKRIQGTYYCKKLYI